MEVSGESYMLMANEGDSKDYSKFGGFNEEERVGYTRLIWIKGFVLKSESNLRIAFYYLKKR
jgi:hypothetical protein